MGLIEFIEANIASIDADTAEIWTKNVQHSRQCRSRRPFPEPGVLPAAARVEIGESTVHGLGLFALAPIRKGEVFESGVGLPVLKYELDGLICGFVSYQRFEVRSRK